MFIVGRQPAPTIGGGYEAIFLRSSVDAPDAGVDIIAVRPDGKERLVRHLDSADLPDNKTYETYGSVSQDGWVAVGTHLGVQRRYSWALMDLNDTAKAPRLVPYQPVIGGAWGPAGLFATTEPASVMSFRMNVVDAGTGLKKSLGPLDLPGGGPDIIWAADGSGLVIRLNVSGRDAYAIARRNGGPKLPGVPRLAPGLGSRWLAQGGTFLVVCPSHPQCLTTGELVETHDAENDVVEWSTGDLASATLVDASFSADGQSVWMLFDRVNGSAHVAVIARADEPGSVRTIATVDLGTDVAHLWFAGLAPDDSSMAIGYWTGELGGATEPGPTRVVATLGGAPKAHTGNFIGFMPEGIN